MQSVPGWLMEDANYRAEDDEIGLLRAAQAGDESALERLLASHEQALCRLCQGILGHREDAEDAVQETFLRALRSLPRFRGASGFRTWLFRIAINVCLDWKRSRQPMAPLNERSDSADHDEMLEATVMRQWQILSALQTLPPQRRALLMLKEVEGWSIAEIA